MVPDSKGFKLISDAVRKYCVHSTAPMIYAELYEKIHSTDNREIEPGNYIMYINQDCSNDTNNYSLVVIKNGTKLNCYIYDILKTSLVEDI